MLVRRLLKAPAGLLALALSLASATSLLPSFGYAQTFFGELALDHVDLNTRGADPRTWYRMESTVGEEQAVMGLQYGQYGTVSEYFATDGDTVVAVRVPRQERSATFEALGGHIAVFREEDDRGVRVVTEVDLRDGSQIRRRVNTFFGEFEGGYVYQGTDSLRRRRADSGTSVALAPLAEASGTGSVHGGLVLASDAAGTYLSDGTPAGTFLVTVVESGEVQKHVEYDGRHYFHTARYLIATDGTPAGTELLLDLLWPDEIAGLTAAEDGVVFLRDGGRQYEVTATDGTAAGTRVLRRFDKDDARGAGQVYALPAGESGALLYVEPAGDGHHIYRASAGGVALAVDLSDRAEALPPPGRVVGTASDGASWLHLAYSSRPSESRVYRIEGDIDTPASALASWPQFRFSSTPPVVSGDHLFVDAPAGGDLNSDTRVLYRFGGTGEGMDSVRINRSQSGDLIPGGSGGRLYVEHRFPYGQGSGDGLFAVDFDRGEVRSFGFELTARTATFALGGTQYVYGQEQAAPGRRGLWAIEADGLRYVGAFWPTTASANVSIAGTGGGTVYARLDGEGLALSPDLSAPEPLETEGFALNWYGRELSSPEAVVFKQDSALEFVRGRERRRVAIPAGLYVRPGGGHLDEGRFVFAGDRYVGDWLYGLHRVDERDPGSYETIFEPEAHQIAYDNWPDYTAQFAYVGGRYFFLSATEATGFELYSSDGTAAGTGLFADLIPGPSSSSVVRLLAAGDYLFVEFENVRGWPKVREQRLYNLATGEVSDPEVQATPNEMRLSGDRVVFEYDEYAVAYGDIDPAKRPRFPYVIRNESMATVEGIFLGDGSYALPNDDGELVITNGDYRETRKIDLGGREVASGARLGRYYVYVDEAYSDPLHAVDLYTGEVWDLPGVSYVHGLHRVGDHLVFVAHGASVGRELHTLSIGGESVRGVVYADDDGDGARGDDEAGVAGVWVNYHVDGRRLYHTRTDSLGRYTIARPSLPEGVVQPVLSVCQVISSADTAYALPGGATDADALDFGISRVDEQSSIAIDLEVEPLVCGGEASLWLSFENLSCSYAYGQIRAVLPEGYRVNSDSLFWGRVDGQIVTSDTLYFEGKGRKRLWTSVIVADEAELPEDASLEVDFTLLIGGEPFDLHYSLRLPTECDDATAVGEPTAARALRLVPNPAGASARVTHDLGGGGGVAVTLTDMLGRVLYREEAYGPEVELDLSALTPGSYLVIVRDMAGGQQRVGRLERL